MLKVKDEYTFSVFLGADFINIKHKHRNKYCTFEKFHGSSFIVIPSLVLEEKEFEEEFLPKIDKYKRIALYANTAQGGGSKIYCYLGEKVELLMQEDGKSYKLPKEDEGLIIMDVDLKWSYTKEPSKEVSIAFFNYEGVLPDYENFIQGYFQEKGVSNKRKYLQIHEPRLFSWWKNKFASKIFKAKTELLLCGYDRLEEGYLDFLVESIFLPRGIQKTLEWRFTYLGRSIQLLSNLLNKTKEEEKAKIEEVISSYKRAQQVLKHKVREEYLESFYLHKGKTLEAAPLKLEEFEWSYDCFQERRSTREIKDYFLASPLLTKEEVESCFIANQKVTSFLSNLNFKESYFFLSPPGSGKSSFLSYLSLKALEQGYEPIFISFYKEVPTLSTFLKRLKIKEKASTILIFDDIDKNISILKLVLDLKKKYPSLPLYLASCPEKLPQEEKRKLISFFKVEELPGLLTLKDLEKFTQPFQGLASPQELMAAFSKKEFPIISLVFAHRQLKEGLKSKQEILSSIPYQAYQAYQRIYYSLNDGERFALKIISYLDGTIQEVVSKALSLYGLDDKVITSLREKDILYQNLVHKLSPSFTTLSILDIHDQLKEVVRSPENTSVYEKTRILPEILIETEEREALIALSSKYQELSDQQKEKLSALLLKNKEDISVLWVISKLASCEDEFMKLSSLAIERVEEDTKNAYARILANFGYIYGLENQVDKAIKLYTIASEISREYSLVWYNLGVLYGRKGEFEKEIQCYAKAIEIDPENALAWLNSGIAYGKKGEVTKEARCYAKAISIDSENTIALYNLGLAYGRKGNIKAQIACFEKAIKADQDYAVSWYNLGVSYRQQGEHEKELKCYEKTIALDPEYALAWYNLGTLYGKKNNIDKEMECYLKALEIDPENALAWYSLAVLYNKRKMIDKEIQCLERSLSIDPENALAWYSLGMHKKKIKDIKESIQCLKKTLSLDPEWALAWSELGMCYEETNEVDKDIKCYERCVDINTNIPQVWRNLGFAYRKQGNTYKTMRCFEKFHQASSSKNSLEVK
ncbi:tetratricopeptide repeat protein [bacterium]|nr:tetratricopeptide repeat protein [bacterium]